MLIEELFQNIIQIHLEEIIEVLWKVYFSYNLMNIHGQHQQQ